MGQIIKSKPSTRAYREGYDRVFPKGIDWEHVLDVPVGERINIDTVKQINDELYRIGARPINFPKRSAYETPCLHSSSPGRDCSDDVQ